MYRVITETLVEVWEHGNMETLLKSTTFYCWFASDVTAAMLVVKNKLKHFSSLGNELYFDANLAEKFLLY